LELDSEVPSTPWDKVTTISLGNEMQVMNLYWAGLQMEGLPKSTWWNARIWSDDFWKTYTATLAWPPIRFLFTLSIIKSWHNHQIDFELAFPQADVECYLYMGTPMGLRLGRTATSIVYRFSSTSMEKNRLVAHDHYI
jgi:hypothetical protein